MVYQTYNQIFKLEWYATVTNGINSSIDEINFFNSNIRLLDKYLPSSIYLPPYNSDDKKIMEKQISVFCDHFLYFQDG